MYPSKFGEIPIIGSLEIEGTRKLSSKSLSDLENDAKVTKI